MPGLVSYGVHIPYHRIRRTTIAAALGGAGGSGTRSVAGYDEDATSMGVEALRRALGTVRVPSPDTVVLATATPPYLDKTNATAVHAALRLEPTALAYDALGSVRSGVGALLTAMRMSGTTAVVLSDVRTGMPSSSDERDGGDAAAALVFSDAPDTTPVAELLGTATTTEEFLDRWRMPGSSASKVWEERFGETVYLPLAENAFTAALKQAALTPDDIDVLLVAGLHNRAVKAFGRATGVRPEARADDLTTALGNAGTAHPGLLLAAALDRAEPDTTIALVVLADGATTFVLRTTEAIVRVRSAESVAAQIAAGTDDLAYNTFLTWRGFLDREPPRRPDPQGPSAPPAMRSRDWKFGFVASACTDCGTRHIPPARVCHECGSVDRTTPVPMADVRGTVTAFTVDRLAHTPSPPLIGAVIDFDGGGRFRCQVTDADPDELRVGLRVEMTFRRTVTAGDTHNYFWKARPVRAPHQA